MPRITLLEMLMKAGLIDRRAFDDALRNRVVHGGKIGTSLIELGYLREEDLARFLSRKLAVPYVPPDYLLNIPEEVIALIPGDLARKYQAIPLRLDNRRLTLVMADPADLKAVDEIAFVTGYIISPVVTPEVRLIQALGKYYDADIDSRYQRIIARIEAQKKPEGEGQEATARPVPPPQAPPPPRAAAEEELEEAEVVTEEWKERVRQYSVDALSIRLARAEDREEVARTLMEFFRHEFRRSALFLDNGGEFIGWKGIDREGEIPTIPFAPVTSDPGSIIATVADSTTSYIGPVPHTPANAQLIEALGGEPPSVALVVPLTILGRVAMVAYAEGNGLEEKLPLARRILAKASLAFEILISREKILML